MTENDASPAAIADGETADDDLDDVVATEDEDFDDESFDLDEGALDLDDNVVVQQLEPQVPDPGDTDDALADEDDFDADRDFDAPDAEAGTDASAAGEDDGDALLAELAAMASAAAAPVDTNGSEDPRLARVEAAARALAAAERERESGKVRRKVKASTTGAGAVGAIPILLQLTGALHLRPEIAAAVSTVAAILGSFAAGWATPERQPPEGAQAAEALLGEG